MKTMLVATSSGCLGVNGDNHISPRHTGNTRWVGALLYFHHHRHLCSRHRRPCPCVTHSCYQARLPPVPHADSEFARRALLQLHPGPPCSTALGVPFTEPWGDWRPCCGAVHSPRLTGSPKSRERAACSCWCPLCRCQRCPWAGGQPWSGRMAGRRRWGAGRNLRRQRAPRIS